MQKTIYLVEDDEGIREMLGFVLSPHYKVIACENLRSFNLQMSKSLPDLVIMDIMLPDGNGDEAGQGLQQNESTKDIPMLFMSANMKFQLPASPATHSFISKPFDIKVFQQKVKDLIR